MSDHDDRLLAAMLELATAAAELLTLPNADQIIAGTRDHHLAYRARPVAAALKGIEDYFADPTFAACSLPTQRNLIASALQGRAQYLRDFSDELAAQDAQP